MLCDTRMLELGNWLATRLLGSKTSATMMILIALCLAAPDAYSERLQLARMRGDLEIGDNSLTPTYAAYIHVPIATKYQVPLAIEVTGDQLISYRFLRTTGDNILVAAQLHTAESTTLSWRAWVLVQAHTAYDRPVGIPIPDLADYSAEVLPFLQPTATAQVNCVPVQDWVGNNTNLVTLDRAAEAVVTRCSQIPTTFNHDPWSFDAYYALMWGNHCTGYAHSATALLRGLGIPARSKLVLLTWYPGLYDMHWTTDYFIPDYGWVGMDTTTGEHPLFTQREVVIYVCDPADEFPLFFTNGADGFWHTSDPKLSADYPAWPKAHASEGNKYFEVTADERALVMDLAREAFNYDVDTRGVRLPLQEVSRLAAARLHHETARDQFMANQLPAGLATLELAADSYRDVDAGLPVTRYASDFEDGEAGWSHGGAQDEWELGTPINMGPTTPHSGDRCWGTDLDQRYENWTDSWLLSPSVDLDGLYSAELEFWIWLETVGIAGSIAIPHDYLFVEVSSDGGEFVPVCSRMNGGNDDPQIPLVPGWARLDLDLTPFTGTSIQVRIRFKSDAQYYRAGAYIDDVKITGRAARSSGVTDPVPSGAGGILSHLRVFPNPFNPSTRITFELDRSRRVRASVYDMKGRRVADLLDRVLESGVGGVQWDGRDRQGNSVPSGSYLLRVEAGGETWRQKLMLVR
jgi:Transglutaminase-like superfamily/FlgD Ig-like domain